MTATNSAAVFLIISIWTLLLVVGGRAQSNFTDVGVLDLNRAPVLFEQAVLDHDLTAMGAFYDENAVFFSPDGSSVLGRDNIEAIYANNFEAGDNVLDIYSAHWTGDDTRAVMVWSWNLDIKPRGQGPRTVAGRSMIYYVKSLLGWKIVLEMFQPLPSAVLNQRR